MMFLLLLLEEILLRENKSSWLWCWTDIEWSRQLFNWGVEDANNNIKELTSFFND